jgi:Holliday junction resolvase RusA-like endonuclease
MKHQLQFKVDGLPPSYNKHFKINYGMRNIYLTQEARMFKQKVKMVMPPFEFTPQALFDIEINYYHDWYYKNGKVRRLDVQNLDKLLIDAVFEKLGTDDSRLWSVTLRKLQKDDAPMTTVLLSII